MSNVSETIGQTPGFRSNCVFREVTPVTHISLKTGQITESSLGKRSQVGI